MYRRWKSSDQPKEEQTPARATANEAALKRDNRSGMSVVGTVETTTGHRLFGRPVTSAGIAKRPSLRVAFLAFGPPVGDGAHRGRNPANRKGHLPAATVRCNIR